MFSSYRRELTILGVKGLNKAFIIIIIIIIIIEYKGDLEHYLCRGENKHSCSALPTELRCLVTAQVVFITAKITFLFTSLSTGHIYDFHIFIVIY